MTTFTAIPSDIAQAYRTGAPDAYGNPPERTVSDGNGNPCRHCLRDIPEGAGMLVLAYRPFPALQPYAETGPVFICADPCERGGGRDLPDAMQETPDFLIKGYGFSDRIVYGTGAIVPTARIREEAGRILARDDVAYLHVRSARNNCYQCRIDRTPPEE